MIFTLWRQFSLQLTEGRMGCDIGRLDVTGGGDIGRLDVTGGCDIEDWMLPGLECEELRVMAEKGL